MPEATLSWSAYPRAELDGVLADCGQLEAGERFLSNAANELLDVGERRWWSRALISLGNIYRRHGRLNDSISALEEALEEVRRLGDRRWEARCLESLASTLRATGQIGEAADAATDAKRLRHHFRMEGT